MPFDAPDALAAADIDAKGQGARMSERLTTLKEARERMVEERDAHAKVLSAPFDRNTAERARNKFTEMQALIEALDRAISGEEIIAARN